MIKHSLNILTQTKQGVLNPMNFLVNQIFYINTVYKIIFDIIIFAKLALVLLPLNYLLV